MKRIVSHILVSSLLIAFFSCQKTPAVISPPPPPPPIDTTPIEYNSKVGAFITNREGNFSYEFKNNILSNLHTKYIRNTLVMENWGGVNYNYEYFTNLGYKTLLNIHYKSRGIDEQAEFPTDTIAYKIQLDEILTKYSPEVVLIENEPGNTGKHTGSIQDYLNELSAAMTVVHSHTLKGADGGLSTRPLTFLVYRYYFNNGDFEKADDFGARCIPPEDIYNLSHPGNDSKTEKDIRTYDSLVKGYKTIPLDYVNVHIYEPIKYRREKDATALSASITTPTPLALKEIADYIFAETGKPIISNEMGQLNLQPALVDSMLKVCNQVKMPYVIWFSGDWGIDNSFALNEPEPNTTLRPNGVAFRDFMDAHPQ